jgi:hypothetical protein
MVTSFNYDKVFYSIGWNKYFCPKQYENGGGEMSNESVKQFWDHIRHDEIIPTDVRSRDWEELNKSEQDSVIYIYHMAIGVMAENRN